MKVTIRGLDGFQHQLQVTEEQLAEGIHTLGSELAKQIARDARANAERGKRSGDAQDSIRARGPVVSAGLGVAYYAFADFGGKVGRKRSVSRPYIKGGRWLYPAVRGVGVAKQAEAVIDQATKGLQ